MAPSRRGGRPQERRSDPEARRHRDGRKQAVRRDPRATEGERARVRAEKLLEVLEWSLALGVECLSVYAFSTDNFKRSKTEVDVLFELAERRLDEMATSPVIHDRRVRVQVLGELHTLPVNVRRAAAARWRRPRRTAMDRCSTCASRTPVERTCAER